MRWYSLLAIYFLFWAFSVFFVLPFGVKTTDEAGGERVPGQAESAPHEAGRLLEAGQAGLALLLGAEDADEHAGLPQIGPEVHPRHRDEADAGVLELSHDPGHVLLDLLGQPLVPAPAHRISVCASRT